MAKGLHQLSKPPAVQKLVGADAPLPPAGVSQLWGMANRFLVKGLKKGDLIMTASVKPKLCSSGACGRRSRWCSRGDRGGNLANWALR